MHCIRYSRDILAAATVMLKNLCALTVAREGLDQRTFFDNVEDSSARIAILSLKACYDLMLHHMPS